MPRRSSLPLLAAVLLGACHESGSSAERANGSSDTPLLPVAPRDDPQAEKSRVRAALDFVTSRLNETDVSQPTDSGGHASTTWTPSAVELGADRWSWTERRMDMVADKDGVAITDTTEHYRLSPRELSYPATAKEIEIRGRKMWSVTIECTTKDCIGVTGGRTDTSQLVFAGEPTTDKRPINDRREDNAWYFFDENAAERVVRALNVVIEADGGQKRQF